MPLWHKPKPMVRASQHHRIIAYGAPPCGGDVLAER